jgi:hypothetical protein
MIRRGDSLGVAKRSAQGIDGAVDRDPERPRSCSDNRRGLFRGEFAQLQQFNRLLLEWGKAADRFSQGFQIAVTLDVGSRRFGRPDLNPVGFAE